jgi:hypothetical protein
MAHGVCGTIVSSVCDGVDIQVVGHVALEADFDESGVCESFNGCVAHVVAAAVASFQMLTAAPNSGKCHDLDVCVVKHVVAALVNVGDYVAATSADWACMNSCLFDGRAVGNWDPCEKDAWWRTPDWLRAVRYRSWLATRVCRQWDVLLVPGSCCGWRVRRRVSTGKRRAGTRTPTLVVAVLPTWLRLFIVLIQWH